MKKLLELLSFSLLITSITGCRLEQISPFEKIVNKSKRIRLCSEIDKDDYWQTPRETDSRKTADCEDIALYLDDFCKRENIPSKVVFGLVYSPTKIKKFEEHTWIEIKIEEREYIFDRGKFIGKENDKDYVDVLDPKTTYRDLDQEERYPLEIEFNLERFRKSTVQKIREYNKRAVSKEDREIESR